MPAGQYTRNRAGGGTYVVSLIIFFAELIGDGKLSTVLEVRRTLLEDSLGGTLDVQRKRALLVRLVHLRTRPDQ